MGPGLSIYDSATLATAMAMAMAKAKATAATNLGRI